MILKMALDSGSFRVRDDGLEALREGLISGNISLTAEATPHDREPAASST